MLPRATPRPCPGQRGPDGNLPLVSLFGREDVAPPEECSRCGTLVAQTSLFCPSCGQSRVTPMPKPQPEADTSDGDSPNTPELDESSPAEEEQPAEVPDTSQTGDTLSRATQWIRRTLGRGSSTPEPEPPDPDDSPLLSEKPARQSYPERLQQSSRARARFVLTAPTGHTFTLGEIPGGIGAAESAPEGDQLHWIQLSAPDGSVDAVHLRFGVDDGVFWVEDANSVFGTIVVEPARAALQCIPYERYHLVRGSEIRLGSLSLQLA